MSARSSRCSTSTTRSGQPTKTSQTAPQEETDMARTTDQTKIDPTRAFYAAVGGVDVAVAFARTGLSEAQTRLAEAQTRLADAQTRLAQADSEPKVLVDGLQKEAKAPPSRVEALLNEYVAELGDTVEDLNKQYVDLAARGRTLVGRIRRQEATKELKSEVKSTTSRAKTATTQTRKAAGTAKRSTKATGTSARKTASATKKAARGAAAKTGALALRTHRRVGPGPDRSGADLRSVPHLAERAAILDPCSPSS